MLNPSRADASIDDPTIRKCIEFTRRWGYGAIDVVNLYAWRATDPSELCAAIDPIGDHNDTTIIEAAKGAALVVCAWGAGMPKTPLRRDDDVYVMLRNRGLTLHHLGLTKHGHPRHPLYVPAKQPLVEWAY